jgi:hypothetical protein
MKRNRRKQASKQANERKQGKEGERKKNSGIKRKTMKKNIKAKECLHGWLLVLEISGMTGQDSKGEGDLIR